MTLKEEEFCKKLTSLLLEYGFGISGEPYIYELQVGPNSDYGRQASIDEEGRLNFI